jgi:lipopolysaccharide biosynthesis regulator YciM
MRLVLIIVACAAAAFGQRHKIEEVNAEKPEGKLLQQIMQENDASKKTALLDQFSGEFPKHDSTPWVLEQLQGIYVKANDPDKIIATGDKLLALDPDDPEAALQCMKAAEAKKDGPAIKKYSMATWAAARKMGSAPQPKEADEVTAWKASVEYAKQVEQYADYALYRTALESRDAKLTIDVGEALIARNPQGEYSNKVMEPLFVAYRQAGDNAKAAALAEKAVASGQGSEDMLLVLANQYLEQKKEPEKVHTYTAKIVQQMGQKPKPEGISDGDWTARRNLYTGLAHYMNGKLYHNENNFAKADVELRAALPLVEGNAAVKPEVLYMLALSNFKLEKPQEAANYFRACAAIKSPFQQMASTNLARMKTQYTGIK